MKKPDKKTIIILAGILIVILALGIILFNNNNKDNNKNLKENKIIENDEPGIIEDKTIGDIKFSNIECFTENKSTTVKYTITNNGDETVTLEEYELVFKDKDKKVIGTIYAGTSTEIDAEESLNIETTSAVNIEEATSMELKLVEVDEED